MIDFNALRKNSSASKKPQSPRDIYISLPQKHNRLSSYPRDVQSEVWQQWFDRRSEKDLVIKMNTGGGKTIVGLLLLQSSIQEGIIPAVYVVPNNMLAAQALEEAKALGINATQDVHDHLFRSGKSILITNIHKLVNGKSVFGIKGGQREILNIGALVFDDAHTALESIEDQFSLNVKKSDGDIYDGLFRLFEESLKSQKLSTVLEIKDEAPHRSMLVPYWSWQKNISKVIEIFTEHREDESIKFNWPLIQDHLFHCHCVITGTGIEITPHCIPISMIPSVTGATRKVFMTATLADDSVLSTHFGVSPKTIEMPIVPMSAGDVGDRIVLAPQHIDPSLTDDDCIAFAKKIAQDEKVNVIAIVPSALRSIKWSSVADETWISDQVDPGIARLRSGEKIGLVVLINRYDGIDLPDDACRVLFLDGLPDIRSSIEVIKQGYLSGSKKVASQIAQRIEQGAGRGVRSINDYCAVILMGKSLCAHVYTKGVREKFSPALSAQLVLSEEVSPMIKDLNGIQELLRTQFLARDPDWIALSKDRLSDLSYTPPSPDALFVAIRNAFDFAEIGDYSSATEVLRECNDLIKDPIVGGLARQYLAEYLNRSDPAEAQKVQKMAVSMNRQLLKPIGGVTYQRAQSAATSQAQAAYEYAHATYKDGNCYSLAMQSVIEDLITGEEYVPGFEAAFSELANFLGMRGSRPEQEFSAGPDVLWSMKKQEYLVIECKSGASADTVSKDYCNQLNGSKIWFDKQYDDCKCFLLMVHPSNKIEYAASLNEGTRIMTFEKLADFKQALTRFSIAMGEKFKTLKIDEIRDLLTSHDLKSDSIFNKYSVPYKSLRR